MVPSLFSRLSSVFRRLQNPVLLVLSSKTVGLEGLSNLLLLDLEGFADFERILVLMCFLCDNLVESLVFKFEPTKPSEIDRLILLGMENFACEVYWFQNSAVFY